MTPPPLARSIQEGFRRYAVRTGSVRSTQKFCYIVRRHQFLLLKGSNFHQETQQTWHTNGMLRPDIFYFSSFKNHDRIFFKKWKKNFFIVLLPIVCKLCRIWKKHETNWVRNYILLCKKRSSWEKVLKSQLWLYLHIYFSIVASICFVEMELCLIVHFS